MPVAVTLLILVSVAAAQSAPAGGPATRTATAPSAPQFAASASGSRLVVLLVVDQLTTDVLRSAWPWLSEAGFRRVAKEGVNFAAAEYSHACTETGPGHATLSTGASAAIHGIVGNEWIDPAAGRVVGCVADPGVRPVGVPTPRRAASPQNLLAPTLAETLRLTFGRRSQVVTLSLKDRAAILMAGRVGDLVLWYDDETGSFTTSSAYAETVPPLLAAFNAAGLAGGFAGWTWDRTGPPGAYADLGPDDDPRERPATGGRTLPRRLPAEAGLALYREIYTTAAGNHLLQALALRAIEDTGLGRDDVPDFLGISWSSNDVVGHQFGPASHEVRDMTLLVDRQIAEVLSALDRTVGAGRYHVILSSDHGVAPIPEIARDEGLRAGRIPAAAVVAAVDAALSARFGPLRSGSWVKAHSDPQVLLDRSAIAALGLDPVAVAEEAARALERLPDVAAAWPVRWILDGRLPEDAIHGPLRRSLHPGRSGDVLMLARPYVLVSEAGTMHGTPWRYDARVPLLFMGPGIRSGYTSRRSVGPGSGVTTIAEALGIGGPAGADHPVLDEAFEAR